MFTYSMPVSFIEKKGDLFCHTRLKLSSIEKNHQVPKNPEFGADADRIRKEEQGKIDQSAALDEDELTEKDNLLKEASYLYIL